MVRTHISSVRVAKTSSHLAMSRKRVREEDVEDIFNAAKSGKTLDDAIDEFAIEYGEYKDHVLLRVRYNCPYELVQLEVLITMTELQRLQDANPRLIFGDGEWEVTVPFNTLLDEKSIEIEDDPQEIAWIAQDNYLDRDGDPIHEALEREASKGAEDEEEAKTKT